MVHGGAGVIPRDRLSAEGQARRLFVLREALAAATRSFVRRCGLEACVAAVRVLEEAPEFNAGRGGVLNADGVVEHDASVMCGQTGAAGAVAGIQGIRSPVLAARAVLEQSEHVLLVGEGARRFAETVGLETCSLDWFVTPGRHQRLQRALAKRAVVRDHDLFEEADDQADAAVGASRMQTWTPSARWGLCTRRAGWLAAATSTGGMTGKHPGRWATRHHRGWDLADRRVALSATGHGEAFIRHHVTGRVADPADLLSSTCTPPPRGCSKRCLQTRGLIGVDHTGAVALPMNCGGCTALGAMPRATKGSHLVGGQPASPPVSSEQRHCELAAPGLDQRVGLAQGREQAQHRLRPSSP